MKDIIKHAEKNDEFIQLEDGFWYYWPKVDKGAISEYDLYCLFQELKQRNKKWNDYINEHFRNQQRSEACKCSVKGEGAGGTCMTNGECVYWNARKEIEEK